jgi:hypothetical protein
VNGEKVVKLGEQLYCSNNRFKNKLVQTIGKAQNILEFTSQQWDCACVIWHLAL